MTESLQGTESHRPSRSRGVANGVGRVAATVVRIVTGLFALILAVHIAFTLFEANPDKAITQNVADWSSGLTLGLERLFTLDDMKMTVLVNYGLAAIAWLVIGALLVRVIRAVLGRRGI